MRWSILAPLGVSAIYCIIVLIIASVERVPSTGGEISLQGMGTFFATFPSSLLIEKLSRFDVKSSLCVAVALLVNTSLLFALLYGVLKLFHVK